MMTGVSIDALIKQGWQNCLAMILHSLNQMIYLTESSGHIKDILED